MGQKNRLHLDRADAVTSHQNDIVLAPAEEEVPLFVQKSGIACEIPAAVAGELVVLAIISACIALKPGQRAAREIHGHATELTGSSRVITLRPQNDSLPSRKRAPHGSRFQRTPQQRVVVIVDQHAGLGLSVVVVNGSAELRYRPIAHLLRKWLSGTREAAQYQLSARSEAGGS